MLTFWEVVIYKEKFKIKVAHHWMKNNNFICWTRPHWNKAFNVYRSRMITRLHNNCLIVKIPQLWISSCHVNFLLEPLSNHYIKLYIYHYQYQRLLMKTTTISRPTITTTASVRASLHQQHWMNLENRVQESPWLYYYLSSTAINNLNDSYLSLPLDSASDCICVVN